MIVELVGPRPDGWDVVVDNLRVPFLTAHPADPDDESGSAVWELILDRRYGMRATRTEIERWGWFLARCMARSAGYPKFDLPFGEKVYRTNPIMFSPRPLESHYDASDD